MNRIMPRSVVSRIALGVGVVLALSQLLLVGLVIVERQDQLFRSEGRNLGRRVESIVQIFSALEPEQYPAFVRAVNTPMARVRLIDATQVLREPIYPPHDRHLLRISRHLEQQFPAQISFRLRLLPDQDGRKIGDQQFEQDENLPSAKGIDARYEKMRRINREIAQPQTHSSKTKRAIPIVVIQVKLESGQWVEIANHSPEIAVRNWPVRLLLIFFLSLLTMFAVVVLLVRQIVKPLGMIALAADTLGKNMQVEPLPEKGASEILLLSRAFNTMRSRLQRFVAERGEMLAAISHDLKTPLTRLRLRVALLNDPAREQEFEQDLDEMEAMINQTIDFMRGETITEKPVKFDMNALIESVQQDMLLADKHFTITGLALCAFAGRVISIKRLLVNLLDNAFRYGESVSVEIQDSSEWLKIRVLDKGPGISVQEREKVFQPFYQIDKARKKTGGGSGLGLGIARNIALNHGGNLTLHANEPSGLIVEVVLPR